MKNQYSMGLHQRIHAETFLPSGHKQMGPGHCKGWPGQAGVG